MTVGSQSHGGQGSAILTGEEWGWIVQTLRLSERESQVLRCLFDDATELEMADRLEISPHTVHSHLIRLYRKLGVRSRCECVVRVFAHYLSRDDTRAKGA